MDFAFGFAVIIIALLLVDRVRQERRFQALLESAFKQGDFHWEAQERKDKLHERERERMAREAQRERSLLLARETSPEMADGAAVAAAMVERYEEMGVPKLHVSVDDDEAYAKLLREQREAMEAQ